MEGTLRLKFLSKRKDSVDLDLTDRRRNSFNQHRTQIRQAFESIDATIKIFKHLKEGPNPEYLTSRKESFYNMLSELVESMQNIQISGPINSQSFYQFLQLDDFRFLDISKFQVAESSLVSVD